MVHGEDDYVTDDDAPSERAAPQLDTGVVGSPRSSGVLGLTLLAVVTLGAVVVVLLSLSHRPTGRQSVAERHSPAGATRRAFPDPPTTAPPEVHALPYSRRHAHAPISPVARPWRRGRRIAVGYAKTPTIAIGPVRRLSAEALAGREFDFER
jgi:hypothetical protein